MPSERMRRQIDALFDQCEEAVARDDWPLIASKARAVLAIDPDDEDAGSYLRMAAANLDAPPAPAAVGPAPSMPPPLPEAVPEALSDVLAEAAPAPLPESFLDGRYRVARFVGEGRTKRVYPAHDERLGRDVAFSWIKVDGPDVDAERSTDTPPAGAGRRLWQAIGA